MPPRLLGDARAATARFHNPAAATAVGFEPTDVCFSAWGSTGSTGDVADGVNDVRKPDILLYERARNGVRLVGVEWSTVDADQDLSTDGDRPSLECVPLDGPMAGHEEGGPVHYDLYLYIWQYNPDGTPTSQSPRQLLTPTPCGQSRRMDRRTNSSPVARSSTRPSRASGSGSGT